MLTTSVFFVKELYYSTQFNINYDSGYSGILLLMLKIGKYLGILTISGIIASLFLGGYSEFGNEGLQVLTFFVKTFIIAIIILLGLNLTLNLKLETIINVLFKIILPILVIWLLVVSFAVFYR
jgi:NADH:ubiquinone oxidoreductase subunit H